MGRVLLVANRLPLTIAIEDGEPKLTRSSGGLVTALDALAPEIETQWVGWPGDISRFTPDVRKAAIDLVQKSGAIPIELTPAEIRHYYQTISNNVLWPLFHYQVERIGFQATASWAVYERVNQRFADVTAQHAKPDDIVWVHDYHLCLVPREVRARRSRQRIGFFLHIPFPSSEVFRVLPFRSALLEGILGANVIAFQTEQDRDNFCDSVRHVLGVEPDANGVIEYRGGKSKVLACPIAIDAQAFAAAAMTDEVSAEYHRVRKAAQGRRIVLGVDRLDYTKGIPRRLSALEHLFDSDSRLAENVLFIQVAVPSREEVAGYAELRQSVNEAVGRINSLHGSPTRSPVHLVYRSVSQAELLALYRAADVMLVTPLRDGMNLVAKEYVAVRGSETSGVLILSEFAGAAAEMREALLVNPYDINAMARAIRGALKIDPLEMRMRMEALRGRIFSRSVHDWARTQLDALTATSDPNDSAPNDSSLIGLFESTFEEPPRLDIGTMPNATRAWKDSAPRLLILDYDGTLVPLAASPAAATPDRELYSLLGELAQLPHTGIAIVSGRPQADLERWFGPMPLTLAAEHGTWLRLLGTHWQNMGDVTIAERDEIVSRMQQASRGAYGSLVESKTSGAAFHFRNVEPAVAARTARHLRSTLLRELSPTWELVDGKLVIEAKSRNVGKGRVLEQILPHHLGASTATDRVLCIGDDRTDEDMFRVLSPYGLTIHVGRGPSAARSYVESTRQVRHLLQALLNDNRQFRHPKSP
jgi:trehalose 6-phosphate synthase/phosphatase